MALSADRQRNHLNKRYPVATINRCFVFLATNRSSISRDATTYAKALIFHIANSHDLLCREYWDYNATLNAMHNLVNVANKKQLEKEFDKKSTPSGAKNMKESVAWRLIFFSTERSVKNAVERNSEFHSLYYYMESQYQYEVKITLPRLVLNV